MSFKEIRSTDQKCLLDCLQSKRAKYAVNGLIVLVALASIALMAPYASSLSKLSEISFFGTTLSPETSKLFFTCGLTGFTTSVVLIFALNRGCSFAKPIQKKRSLTKNLK